MNYLGKYLKKRLKELKMSEREISTKCGISHSYLNQLIKGVNPSTKKNISPTLGTFEKLSFGFGVSVDFLQKVARGLADENPETLWDKPSQQSVNGTGKQLYSTDLVDQIKDFQDFMVEIGFNKNSSSGEEWKTLISELKETVQKHIQEQKRNIS
jgi:transcriptional regulator with XRE-family HTH domain